MIVMVKWKVGTLHFIHLYDSHFLKWTAWRDRVPAASVNTLGKYLEMASVMWGSSLGLVQLVSSKKNLSAVSDLTKIKSAMNIYGMFPTDLRLIVSILVRLVQVPFCCPPIRKIAVGLTWLDFGKVKSKLESALV